MELLIELLDSVLFKATSVIKYSEPILWYIHVHLVFIIMKDPSYYLQEDLAPLPLTNYSFHSINQGIFMVNNSVSAGAEFRKVLYTIKSFGSDEWITILESDRRRSVIFAAYYTNVSVIQELMRFSMWILVLWWQK
jgi:hypothetical protein